MTETRLGTASREPERPGGTNGLDAVPGEVCRVHGQILGFLLDARVRIRSVMRGLEVSMRMVEMGSPVKSRSRRVLARPHPEQRTPRHRKAANVPRPRRS